MIVATFCMDGQSESDQTFDAGVAAASHEPNSGAEGKPSKEDWEMKFAFQPIECSLYISLFVVAIMRAFAQSCTAEVKAQYWQTKGLKRLHGVVDHFVVHRATTERVWVTYERRVGCVR